MSRRRGLSESDTFSSRRQSSPTIGNRSHNHEPLMRQSTISFPIEDHKHANSHPLGIIDTRCYKCKAICPPPETYHNISSHLYCFYTEHSDENYQCRFWLEATQDKPTAKLEVLSSRRPDKYLMSVFMKDPYPKGMYCVKCFQRYGGHMQKNEANNVCRYYDIHKQEAVFLVENT